MAKKIQIMYRENDGSDTLLYATSEAYIVNYKNETVGTKLDSLDGAVANLNTNLTNLSNSKANKATTLAGYGITDGYTKTEVNNLLKGKGSPSKTVNVNIPATWSGSSAPFSVTVACNGITASNNFIIGTQSGLTKAQFDAFAQAGITFYSQTTNSFVLRAWGTKPTIVLPISVVILG